MHGFEIYFEGALYFFFFDLCFLNKKPWCYLGWILSATQSSDKNTKISGKIRTDEITEPNIQKLKAIVCPIILLMTKDKNICKI